MIEILVTVLLVLFLVSLPALVLLSLGLVTSLLARISDG